MNGESQALAPPAGGACGGDRAEIDTSVTFESVREAVDRFVGSAAWGSHFIKHMFVPQKKQDQCEEIEDECTNLEEQTAQLEKEGAQRERKGDTRHAQRIGVHQKDHCILEAEDTEGIS